MKENVVISKREAVEDFGSKDQKKHFEKYGRFNNKKVESALIKTLKEYYETVDVIKVGRGFSYKVGKLRERKVDREDHRLNSHLMSDFTQSLDLFIVSTLEHGGGKLSKKSQTMTDWMLDFGLSNEKLNEAFKSVQNGSYPLQIKELKESKIIQDGQEMVFFDYMSFHQNLKQNLERSIARMEKAKIIKLVDHHYMCVDRYEIKDFYDSTSGVVKSEAVRIEENEFVFIDSHTYVDLGNIDRALRVKYKIKTEKIGQKRSKEEKLRYKDFVEEKDFIYHDLLRSKGLYMASNERLVVKYTFSKKEIMLQAMPNKIIRYLEKYQQNNPELDEIKRIYDSANKHNSHIAAFERFSEERRSHLEMKAKKAEESLDKWIKEKSIGFDATDEDGQIIDYKKKLMTCDKAGKYNELKIQRMYAPVIINMDESYRKKEKEDILSTIIIQ